MPDFDGLQFPVAVIVRTRDAVTWSAVVGRVEDLHDYIAARTVPVVLFVISLAELEQRALRVEAS